MHKQNYENYLRKLNFSENTIRSYLYAANDYKKRFGKITQKKISDYRDYLLENYSVKTVNLRLAGLTKYMRFLKKDKLLPKFVKEQGETYLQNVISSEDYERLNKFGLQISTRGISAELQHFSSIYNINHKTLHPHSFRHFFAKNFLEKGGDITFLADLLGHESLETTRIYLRKSIGEQKKIVNTIVKW